MKHLSDIVNGQGTAPAKPQTPIQMGPLVVIGNRPTKKRSVGAGADFKSADAGSANAPTFPSQAESDAFVKKISALVGEHGSSQAKPQTPIQMGPLVVIGTRPPKSPSAGIEGSDIGSGGLTENAGSDAPDAGKPQTPQPTPGSPPVNPTTTILNPPPPTAKGTLRFAQPVLVDTVLVDGRPSRNNLKQLNFPTRGAAQVHRNMVVNQFSQRQTMTPRPAFKPAAVRVPASATRIAR